MLTVDSARTRTAEYGRDGAHENPNIQRDAAAVGVLDVEPEHVSNPELSATAHLPQPRHSGRYLESAVHPRFVIGEGVRNLRPRADKTHFAFHDVDELRELVEARLSNERAHSCDARVARNFVEAARLSDLSTQQLAEVLPMHGRIGISP